MNVWAPPLGIAQPPSVLVGRGVPGRGDNLHRVPAQPTAGDALDDHDLVTGLPWVMSRAGVSGSGVGAKAGVDGGVQGGGSKAGPSTRCV